MVFITFAVGSAFIIAGIATCYVYIHSRQNNRPLGGNKPSKHHQVVYVSKKSHFPAEWWSDGGALGLERRAVFSKEWLCATHSSRFLKPGDYHSVTVGGFPILIVMGKDKVIRAFHDVCRHRAYKVTKKSTGSTLVFGCRYHGWSYDTTGALVRAPEFEKVATFQWDKNGLFPVKLRVSSEGLIFVNFRTRAAEPHFQSNALSNKLAEFKNATPVTLAKEVEMQGAFNWKLISQESFSADSVRVPGTELSVFPNSRLFSSKKSACWVFLFYEPVTSIKTQVRIDVYTASTSTDRLQEDINAIESQARQHVQALEHLHVQLVKKNAENIEFGQESIGFQMEIETRMALQKAAEEISGGDIFDSNTQENISEQGLADEIFCKQLDRDCKGLPCGKKNAQLSW